MTALFEKDLCQIEGCINPLLSRGCCSAHYSQFRRKKQIMPKAPYALSEKQRIAYRIAKLGPKNPNWKGDGAGKGSSFHLWVRRNKIRVEFCEICGLVPPRDLANISGEYKRDVRDFVWLCRKCHMLSDGRMANLKQYVS